jgi:DNA-binding NtrC family response regulator
MASTVLVVDDRAPPRRALAVELADAGFRVVEAVDGQDAWSRFRDDAPDLVITDLVMPRSDGIELVSRIRSQSSVPVIVFTAHGSVEAAVAAMKSGADEFVASAEVDPAALVALARRMAAAPEAAPDARRLAERLVGESPSIRRVRERIGALAPLREPVLICGEPGTGRDTVARALHDLGPGRSGPFVRVAGGAGAGPRELPASGTVYLDGVDRFAPEAQRRLAEWMSRLPGRGAAPAPRFVASALPDLAHRVDEGAFDAALAARLRRFELWLPPLRERPEDVPRIARALLGRLGRELGRAGLVLDASALARLRGEAWPGNAAELVSILEKLVAFATAPVIREREVRDVLAEFRTSVAGLRDRAAWEERRRLVEALGACGGNVTRAAERLGRSRAAVYRLVEKHGVPLRREY